MREAIIVLAQKTGWGLSDLLEQPEDELIAWLETCRTVLKLQNK